ncbi:hypothetical protein, partial [Hymenobacter arizonensis]
MLNILAFALLQFAGLNSSAIINSTTSQVAIGNSIAAVGGSGGWAGDIAAVGGSGGWAGDIAAVG